uniref:Peptidase S1 domain-containing protein n=1 Tax=Mesocestoides corti TaxID=53468 RepID=A0A5K3F7Y5_MESCO
MVRVLLLLAFVGFYGASFGLELNLDPDELIVAQRQSAGGLFFYDSKGASLLFNRSLFVYRDSQYDDWSKWSACSPHTCLEHRFRRCSDDSYLQPVNQMTSARVCPFKFIAEERPCSDKSNCISNARPSQEIERMRSICGVRGNEDKNVRKRPQYDDYDEEEPPYRLKILGGRPSKPKSWPWQVGIYKAANYNASEGLTRLKSENIMCGGTLIAPKWVLTAAHCVKMILRSRSIPFGLPTDIDTPEMAPISMLVRVGDTRLDGTNKQSEQESDHVVDQVIIHPYWVAERVNSPYDIALLRLETPADLSNDTAGVACIPREEDSGPPEDAICYSVGWGENTKPQGFDRHPRRSFFRPFFWPFVRMWPRRVERPTTLREIRVSINPPEKCFHHDDENDVQICAGSQQKGVCAGDTGGGLFCKNEKDGLWYVYGVMGSGPTQFCSTRRWLYNSVGSVTKWINHYVV